MLRHELRFLSGLWPIPASAGPRSRAQTDGPPAVAPRSCCVCVARLLPRVPYTCSPPSRPEFHTVLSWLRLSLRAQRRRVTVALPNVCPGLVLGSLTWTNELSVGSTTQRSRHQWLVDLGHEPVDPDADETEGVEDGLFTRILSFGIDLLETSPGVPTV